MTKDCKLGNPTEDIGYMIWRISKFWQRGKHRTLDEFGLTGPQLEVLGAIYHMNMQQIKVTQIIISQETDIDPMTTSTILRNLQKKDLIIRRESTTDTRARIVELTEKGVDLFQRAIIKVKQIQDTLFQNLDKEALKKQLQLLLVELDRLSKINN